MNDARKNAFGTIGFGFIQGLIILIFTLFWSGVPSYGIGLIETANFPVVTPAKVFNVRAVDGGSLVSATSHKERGCDWIRTEFRFGPRVGRGVPMPRAAHRDPPRVNTKGDVITWDNIFLPVTPDMVKNTHWNAYHYCYPIIKWVTKTHFYN